MFNENDIWKTMDGRQIKFKDLSDTHLANIIDFLGDSDIFLKEYLIRLALKRGLTWEFLNRSQIPYKNSHNKWEIYDTKNNYFQQLEK